MSQQSKPPVVTIMGHVDHGKTTLLDYIRQTKVQASESGGITQHIGAYSIDFKGKQLTFIDTPGHAAFNKMRERGAQVTDIVVLVVAANDGVKPQTIESINHIKKAKVPVIVAVNKIDLPDVYPDMAKGQLAEHGIMVTGMGGDVEAVEVSAKTGKGVDQLLETIMTMAELMELKADPAAPLQAVVIESSKDAHRGPVASVIVKSGTLEVKQDLLVDGIEGRVKALVDETGQRMQSVTPGLPVEIIGLQTVPAVGSIIHDVNDVSLEDEGLKIEEEETENAVNEVDPFADLNFDTLFEPKPKLKLIIKADVEGTLEAIKQNLDEESVELINSGVGEVTASDVEMAVATGAKILAFRVKVDKQALKQAKIDNVRIKVYDIIYKLIEDLQKQMLKLMDATIDEVVTGEAEIVQIFEMKGMKIAGCKLKSGEIKKSDKFHLKRGEEIVADPVVGSLMHGKEEIALVKNKGEFGATFKNKKLNFQVGDMLIAYKIEDE